MIKEKNEEKWVICPECKIKLKQSHISTHMQHVHNKTLDESSETLIPATMPKKIKKPGPLKKSKSKMTIGLIVIIIVIIAASIIVLSMNKPEGSNNNGDGAAWLKNYKPVYNLGTDSNNFWVNFPIGNPSVGQSVSHLSWITEDLKEKPVVFVCHRTGCASCTPQADRVKALIKTYGEDIVFYDLDDDYAGTATADILAKYNAAFYYDPNGGSHYIALTGVFTLIKDGGEVKIGWHSWEGNVEDAPMENWIKDSIYYYHINK
ncbi:MAG: hypothetical protein MUO82_04340 [Candidatus Thermoplasmatota archaeon]|nr:hypothetical protein [Candidatus Thermoplasmatota archaeon]